MKLTTIVVMFATVSALAQTTERIDVNVVNVDVTVLDRSGKPVPGLTKSDFKVLEDGVEREITNFATLGERPTRPQPAAVPAVDAASLTQPSAPSRHIVVFIDERSDDIRIASDLTPHAGMRDKLARNQALTKVQDMAAAMNDDSQWSVVTLGVRGSLYNSLPFTTDRGALRAALENARQGIHPRSVISYPVAPRQLAGGSLLGFAVEGPCATADCFDRPSKEHDDAENNAVASSKQRAAGAQQAESETKFIGALVQTIRSVAWLECSKSVLVVTARLPGSAVGDVDPMAQVARVMAKEANAANVRVFVLDPLGVSSDFDASSRTMEETFVPRGTQGALWLASTTGGLYLGSNRVEQSLQKFDAATTSYYELAFRTASDDNKYHTINVQLVHPCRCTVSNRAGYVRLTRDTAFEKAMLTPFGIASQRATLPVSITLGKARTDGKRVLLPVAVRISTKDFVTLHGGGRAHIYFSVFNAVGDNVAYHHASQEFAAGEDLVVTPKLALQAGAHRIYVVVRDDIGDEVGVAMKEASF